MSMRGSSENVPNEMCVNHDYELMKPIVLASWRLAQYGTPSLKPGTEIIAESRSLQEVYDISNSNLKLVYSSQRASGYLSTLELRLTPSKIPDTLKKIFLRINIEGSLFEKTFEADPNLKFTYSWQRLNIYKQRVYGTTKVAVKVGFLYHNCFHTIWDTQTTQILGQHLDASSIGGWDFNIHHRYNYQDGILHKGDGTTVFLKERPMMLVKVIGDGKPRDFECYDCHQGHSKDLRLLSPISIASTADGSLIVGDFDLIRRINPNGEVKSILRMKPASGGSAFRYHIAVNPHDDSVYISDPELYKIIKILDSEDPKDINDNSAVIAGTGIRCLPGDEDGCGDGGSADEARLIYPKGIALSADQIIYFADGTSIRKIQNGVISTLVGGKTIQHNTWTPLSCKGSLSLEEAVLRWPTSLSVNPLDNLLYFIDDNLVMKITQDSRVQTVAGRPLHCNRQKIDDYLNFAAHTTLVSPQSLAFSPDGDLFIAESDSRRINRVSVVKTDNRISTYAGKDSICNCQENDCPCFEADGQLALDSVFGSISSIAFSPNGKLFVSDLRNRRVQMVQTEIPKLTSDQEYEVNSPENKEIYVFNRYGLHTDTKDIFDEAIKYKFSYSVSTSNGKLKAVSDKKR